MAYQSKHSGTIIDNNIDTVPDLQTQIDNLTSLINNYWKNIYPVGSIYISLNASNPSNLFGGTWKQIQDSFLLASGQIYEANTTGGSSTHNHQISLGKAWATIGNYSERLTFCGGISAPKWKDWTASIPYTWTHTADEQLTSSHTRYDSGVWTNVFGSVDDNNSLPPYLTVYMWQRTA